MHSLTNVKVVSSNAPLEEEKSLRVLRVLTRAPEKYKTWFERYSAGPILRLVYSKPVMTGEKSFIRRILGVMHTVERVASPGAYQVDTLPFLMYLPSFLAPFNLLQESIETSEKSGDPANENFCGNWHANKSSFNVSDDHAAYTIGTLFEAGAGTTASTMMSFMLAMTLYPTDFGKLQFEIDSVVGPDCPPQFTDLPQLPRIRAIAKQTLRLRPVTAGRPPHQFIKDDTYKLPNGESYFLPAGKNVHPVRWAIHHEPKWYADPDSFRPERCSEPDGPTFKEPLEQYPNLHNFSAFGLGGELVRGRILRKRLCMFWMREFRGDRSIGQKVGGNGEKARIQYTQSDDTN